MGSLGKRQCAHYPPIWAAGDAKKKILKAETADMLTKDKN